MQNDGSLVLVVNSNSTETVVMRRTLEAARHFIVHVSTSGRDGLNRIAATPYVLVMLDTDLPDISASQFLEAMNPSPGRIPVVVTSKQGNDEVVRSLFSLGASDFVLKTPDAIRALPRIAGRMIERQRLHGEIVQLRAQLTEQSSSLETEVSRRVALAVSRSRATDELTGLHARSALWDLIEGLRRRQQATTVLLIDVKGFRLFNERHGVVEADRVLRSLGIVVRQLLKPNEIAGRYDSDAIAIVIPEDEARARKLFEQIREQMVKMVADKRLAGSVELRVGIFSSAVPSPQTFWNAEAAVR